MENRKGNVLRKSLIASCLCCVFFFVFLHMGILIALTSGTCLIVAVYYGIIDLRQTSRTEGPISFRHFLCHIAWSGLLSFIVWALLHDFARGQSVVVRSYLPMAFFLVSISTFFISGYNRERLFRKELWDISFFETIPGKVIRWGLLYVTWYIWLFWYGAFSHNLGLKYWGLPVVAIILVFTIIGSWITPLGRKARWIIPAIMAIIGSMLVL